MAKQTQNVGTHLSKIAHINLLLAVCVLLGVAGVYGWLKWGMDSNRVTNTTNTQSARTATTNTVPTAEETAKITEEYQNGVRAAMKDLDLSDATAVQTAVAAVTALRLPGDLRSFQVQLLAALQNTVTGDVESANQRLAQLHAQYSWFTE